MKLYHVIVMTDVVVVADDETEARYAALQNYDDADNGDIKAVKEITKISDVPKSWNAGCIPFGDHMDRTIREWLDRE